MLKKLYLTILFIVLLCINITIFGDESATTYFPNSVVSHWIYEDQDGNEITRESSKGTVIPSQTFHVFSYEPAIEEWFDYIPHLQPNRFKIEDDGIIFYNSDELATYIKTRLTREIEALLLMDPPGEDLELTYEITSNTSDPFLFLPLPVSLNEEWDTGEHDSLIQINVNDTQDDSHDSVNFAFSAIESATVVKIETVETPAGTFEDCYKIEFKTETDINTPLAIDNNPPGETETTLWLAPNVGIVKCHREMEDVLIKSIRDDDIQFTTTINTLELKEFEVTDTNRDENINYFPVSLGSYWVYVDQDGKEFTRRVIADEVVPEKRLKSFRYRPAIEGWEDYDVYAHPELYEVTDDGIVLHEGDSTLKALQARLNRELDVIKEITNRIQESMQNDPNSKVSSAIEIKHEVDMQSQDLFQFLPNPLTINEEWDVMELKAKVNMQYFSKNTQNRPNNRPIFTNTYDITIIETGRVVGKESVETPAGKFDDCLKVEFRTETTMNILSDRWQAENAGTPGETITTLWIAPNVGIVKFYKRSENIILKAISKSSENDEAITEEDIAKFNAIDIRTLELKEYEIKHVDAERNNEN